MSLDWLGWNSKLDDAFRPHRDRGRTPARVAREDRDGYLLLTAAGEHAARLSGRLRHDARGRLEWPAVGDWVAVRRADGGPGVIDGVLPRASAFVRKVAGDATAEQVVAANVDTVLLVSGLDGDFNPRRIERYLAAAWESGAAPVVVLNKADLEPELEARIATVESVAIGVPVVALSARTGAGLEALAPWVVPGRTVALLGSSGVGKSTIVNALLGGARQATAEVRADDSRGRHTTTRRELVPLPGGGVLIDTPGMRELQLWGDAGLPDAFPDIASLASECRFRDCGHAGEPGCRVIAAVEEGGLEPARLESWRKLQRELRHLARRQDARARARELSRWKQITRAMRRHPKAGR
ncbi:MAG TPA: ribosome small subunit-dependent GTPase A [Candidatus Eisenbacteria bacterium]